MAYRPAYHRPGPLGTLATTIPTFITVTNDRPLRREDKRDEVNEGTRTKEISLFMESAREREMALLKEIALARELGLTREIALTKEITLKKELGRVKGAAVGPGVEE